MTIQAGPTDLRAVIIQHFEQNITVPEVFFQAEAERIAQACLAMARRFQRGGRLLSMGEGPSASDAQHIAVEFVHPVLMGKRALPAMALTGETARENSFARQLALLGRAEDIAVAFSASKVGPAVLEGLQEASRKGLLTLLLTGETDREMAGKGLNFCFAVPTGDPATVQETHRTLYHILWELIHVFLEHEGLFESELK